MKLIPLSSDKYPNLFSKVDDEDFERINKYSWYAVKDGNTFYAYRSSWRKGKHTADKIQMAREILGVKNADHKNGNGLDNQRNNLRPANKAQNKMNSFPHNGRKFKGAFKSKHGITWTAAIQTKRKIIYIGCFKTQEDAAKAYDIKAKELFGEYARLNFP